MTTLRKLFIFVLVLALLMPVSLAQAASKKTVPKDVPLSIKDAEIYTKNGLLAGWIKVCNDNLENTRFSYQAENMAIHNLYRRNLQIKANKCDIFPLHFTQDFSIMANVDDQVKISIKRIQGLASKVNFDRPDDEFTTIVEGNRPNEGCADSQGDDGTYVACQNDFIYHESGLRIRVLETNYRYADLMLAGLRWGGTEKLRIYKDRTKQVYAGNNPYTLLNLTSVSDQANRHLLTLEIESE